MTTVETATSTPTFTVEPLDDHASAVRFEPQCIVIPDHAHRSRRPRVVTKSYALPLWKRRTSPARPSATSAPPEDEENQSHLVLRVPLPTFSRKPHSATRSVDHTPLPPCLVHRAQQASESSCASSPPLARHTRSSRKPSPSPSRSDIVTVPLRPCCAACQSVTEAALVGGDAWPEYFSRAASRRRSLSTDGSPRTITVAGSAASASYGNLGVSISVDEIDKRRRSSDTGPSTTSHATLSDDPIPKEEYRLPFILRRTAAVSSSSAADARSPPSPTCITPATPRIPEEEDDEDVDESELFPLPSPKRTPTPTPTPSPAGSLSSLMVGQGNQGSAASPTPSTCSGESAGLQSSKRHFLAPPPCSSSSSLSLPKFSESTTDLALPEDPPRASSPSLLSTLPSLSGRIGSRPPEPRISFIPPTPTDSATDSASPKTPYSPGSVPEPASITIPSSPDPSHPSTSPHHSPTHTRFPWRSRRSVSTNVISPTSSSATPSYSPSTSPTMPTASNTKKPFSMSSPRHIIADMLRGAGTGAIGIAPGI